MASDEWSIDVAAARGVLTNVENQLVDFDSAATDIANAVAEASVAAKGGATAAALVKLGTDPLTADVLTTQAHITNALNQTRIAITAYDDGDYQMALETQRKLEGQ